MIKIPTPRTDAADADNRAQYEEQRDPDWPEERLPGMTEGFDLARIMERELWFATRLEQIKSFTTGEHESIVFIKPDHGAPYMTYVRWGRHAATMTCNFEKEEWTELFQLNQEAVEQDPLLDDYYTKRVAALNHWIKELVNAHSKNE